MKAKAIAERYLQAYLGHFEKYIRATSQTSACSFVFVIFCSINKEDKADPPSRVSTTEPSFILVLDVKRSCSIGCQDFQSTQEIKKLHQVDKHICGTGDHYNSCKLQIVMY